jgi:hypothetical protein
MIGKHLAPSFLLFILLASCAESGGTRNNPQPPKDPVGTLDYRADIDPNRRLYPIDGTHIVASVQLYYSAPPQGAQDGDSGADLYIQINDESKLTEGAKYNYNDSAFNVYAAEWASPAGYDVFGADMMQGSFTVVKYEQYRKLVLDIDITYGDESWSHEYKEEFTFKNSNPWVWTEVPALGWEGFDTTSTFAQDSISIEALSGEWTAQNVMMKKDEKASELIVCDNVYQFTVNGNQFRTDGEKGEWLPLNLNSNSLGQGEKRAVINQISQDSLTLTWIYSYAVMRYSYTRKK